VEGTQRDGFAAVDRTDACRYPRRHAGDRARRRSQCRIAGCRGACPARPGLVPCTRRLADTADAGRDRAAGPSFLSGQRQPVVGILGGGQLARMLALAGAPLGARTMVVDSSADACAGQVAPLVVADWTDYVALEAFAAQVDVVTFDFENVPAETARWLAERVAVFPAPQALAVAQDRLA